MQAHRIQIRNLFLSLACAVAMTLAFGGCKSTDKHSHGGEAAATTQCCSDTGECCKG